ncbi:hypothetical protein [Nocardia anaemiae]|uniref:hypothetical protein n=1 Tax=Nocardia anaemiae TaxID=263910 RepID=UPI0007A5252B|nr:hypothetical protein [Nocardia anaemiae]
MDRPDMTSRANSDPQPGAAPQQPLGAPRAYQTPTPPNPFHRIGFTEDDAPTGPIPRIPIEGAPIDTGPLRRVPIDRAATPSGPLPRVPVDTAPTNTDPFRRIRGQQGPGGQAPNPQGPRQTGPIPRIPRQEIPAPPAQVPYVSTHQAPTVPDGQQSLMLPEPVRQAPITRNPSPPTPAAPRPPAPQDPNWHTPVPHEPPLRAPLQRDPMRQNPIRAFHAEAARHDPNHYAPGRHEQNPIDSEFTRQELDYRGEWSEWVEEPAEEPKPPAPDYFRHEAALAAMIDRSGRNRSKRRWMPVLVGSVAAAGLLVVAFVQIRPDPQPATVASSTPSQVAVSGSTSAAECRAERVGDTITGNGAGGLDSGPGVIFAFQYAYYVTRSGAATREFVAPNASVSPAGTIQQGIDGIPAGTTHCISITPGASVGQYLVQVTEYRPDSTSITYKPQIVTTARVGNQTLITGIGAA